MIVQVVLFIATFLSTLVAGTFLAGGNPLKNPLDIVLGLMFAVPLLSILSVHEMGHYVAARRHGVVVTPPYFIPAPSFIGTFGAFIKIKSAVPHRDALMDIGAAGPIAGAIVAVPVLLVGLGLSVLKPSSGLAGIPLGESLLFKAATYAVLGSVPSGFDVVLHPVAFAGWIGLLVTALNLLPSGQLDGGHIAYALFGPRYGKVARAVPYLLLPMGFLWGGWVIWAVLLFFLGTRHPAPVFDEIPLSRGRRIVGLFAAALFLLCFTPNPVPM
ncbi:MAG: site-2 protease family protein [Gemmatimonadota bacterium]